MMSITIVFINIFQHFYYIIKNNNITKLLSSNIISYDPVKRILIMSMFHKMVYNKDFLVSIEPEFKGYKIMQNTVDKYTFAVLNDGIIMIDFDNKTISLSEIKESLDEHPYSYSIVKSAGGYHVFITNSYFDLTNINALNVMTSFKGVDLLFSFFTFMNGTTNVRMCRKESEDISKPIYTFIQNYISPKGKQRNVWPKTSIQKTIMNHIKETENYKNIIIKDKENFRGILVSKKFTELENIKNSILDPKFKYAEIKYDITPKIQKMLDNKIGINGLYNNVVKHESLRMPVGLSYHYVPFTFFI